MKYHEITKSYTFCEFECGLTVEEAAEKCQDVQTVDKGRELSTCDGWENCVMRHDRLELLTGQRVTAQQVLIGVALLELRASNDSEVAHLILRYTRVLKNMV